MPSGLPRRFCCDEDLALIGYDGRDAEKDVASWRSRGPRPATQELIDAIKAHGVDGAALLPDSVICCYPYLPALMAAAVAGSPRLVGLTYPRDVWWMRAYVQLFNVAHAMRRSPARGFFHRHGQLRGLMAAAGYAEIHDGGSPGWRVVLYGRA